MTIRAAHQRSTSSSASATASTKATKSDRHLRPATFRKTYSDIFNVLNQVTQQIFSQFHNNGTSAQPKGEYGKDGKGFGYGTVHHAVGSARMPYRPAYNQSFAPHYVVDQDLRLVGTNNVYVCDMSVLPFSSAANPVRTLVALALRLSRHIG
jgi:choline dehydrogenase-like flavoprotein